MNRYALDIFGCVELLIAVIKQARRDACKPIMCSRQQREQLQREAQAFLTLIEQEKAEIVSTPPLYWRRLGSIRWEFDETADSRRMYWNRSEQRNAHGYKTTTR